jgi:hypothetical protein
MYSHPCDWRDNDANAGIHDPALGRRGNGGEKWEYLGNIFDMLPYDILTGGNYVR